MLINFDNVFFNTNKFLKDIYQNLKKLNIEKKDFYETYQEVRQRCPYNPSNHLAYLLKRKKFDFIKAVKVFDEIISKSFDYIYNDVNSFINCVKNKNFFLILYAKGDREYIKRIIDKTGFEEVFDDILVTFDYNKLDVLEIKYQNYLNGFVIIEDKEYNIKKIAAVYPQIKLIYVSRKADKRKCIDTVNNNIFEINDLNDKLEFIL